ncbi:MAG: hypothetical protein U0Q15_13970 [Kineosporiaceae bacterium]
MTAWLQATWEESAMLGRVGHLAVPVARAGDPLPSGYWLSEVDGEGRLRRLRSADGAVLVEATEVIRLRATQDVRSAAARVLAAGAHRRPHGLVAVVDDASRFIGVLDPDTLFLAHALAPAAPGASAEPTSR